MPVTYSPSEIHSYPLTPPGEPQPLWRSMEWRKRVADHLADSGWLFRASELPVRSASTQATHTAAEPVYVLVRDRGSFVVRCRRPERPSWRKRRVEEVIDLWREVREWWDEYYAVDRLVARVLLSGDVIVDLARHRREEWSLVGIVD